LHVCHITQYLQVIRDAGITLNLDSVILVSLRSSLWEILSVQGVERSDPERTQCMSEMPRPRTTRELRWNNGILQGLYPTVC